MKPPIFKNMLQRNIAVETLLLISFFTVVIAFLITENFEAKLLLKNEAAVSGITASSMARNRLLVDLRKGSDLAHVNLLRYLFYTDPMMKSQAKNVMLEEARKNDSTIALYKKHIADVKERMLYDSLILFRNRNSRNRLELINLIEGKKQKEAVEFNSSYMYFSYEDYQQANSRLASYVGQRDVQVPDWVAGEFHSTTAARRWKTNIVMFLLFVIGVLIFRIISKLKKTNERLLASELQYRTLVERTTEIIQTVDHTGRIVSANKAFMKKLNYSESDLSVITIDDILSPDSRFRCSLHPERRLAGELLTGVSETLHSKDGKSIVVEGNIILNYEKDQFVSATAFLNDITEKVRLEKQLAVSEENYRRVFMSIPMPMWIFDPETYFIVKVNPAAIAHYGFSEQEFLSMTIFDIRPATEAANLTRALDKERSVEFGFAGEFVHHKKSGERIDVRIYSSAVVFNERNHRVVMAVDVTESNRFEQRLTRSMIRAQEEERYQIGTELHDNVCQILAATQIRMGLIKNNVPSEKLMLVGEIEENIKLATREIRNLSHRLAPAFFDDTNLYDAFNSLLNSVNFKNDFQIRLSFEEAVLSAPVTQELKLNMYRILQEQVRNIIKYSQASRIIVRVMFRQSTLIMRIMDDGVGFEVGKVSGGIGIANMKRRAAMFDGILTVLSSPGRGCEVALAIPLANSN